MERYKKVCDISNGDLRRATQSLTSRISGVLDDPQNSEIKKIRDVVRSFLNDFTKVNRYTKEFRDHVIAEFNTGQDDGEKSVSTSMENPNG